VHAGGSRNQSNSIPPSIPMLFFGPEENPNEFCNFLQFFGVLVPGPSLFALSELQSAIFGPPKNVIFWSKTPPLFFGKKPYKTRHVGIQKITGLVRKKGVKKKVPINPYIFDVHFFVHFGGGPNPDIPNLYILYPQNEDSYFF